jgi:hypothetical protein
VELNLNDEERSSLKTLVVKINDAPRYSKDERAQRHSRWFKSVFPVMAERGISLGEAAGKIGMAPFSPDGAEFRANVRKIANDVREQIRIVSEGVDHYYQAGQNPAPYYAMRIAIILRKLKQSGLEEEFLAAFNDKFSDGIGGTYQKLVSRLERLRSKKRWKT